jgi:hypothetical protein
MGELTKRVPGTFNSHRIGYAKKGIMGSSRRVQLFIGA